MNIRDELDAAWDYSNPSATRERFEALRERLDDLHDRLQLATQIARTHGLERDADAAHAVLDDVERRLTDATDVARSRYLLERGRVHNTCGAKADAIPLFFQAFEHACARGHHGLAVDAAHMLGIACESQEALRWNLDAIAYAEAHSDDPSASKWLGSLYNNTGWSLHDLSRHEDALALFERALAFHEERGASDRVAIARWCVGRCLRSLERTEEALSVQLELERFHAERGTTSGYVHEELGELFLVMGRAERAREHFDRAHAILSEDTWLAHEEPERLARIARLSEA